MLLYLCVAFQLFRTLLGQLSCYNCPLEANSFNTIITADTLPTELNNCSSKSEQYHCSIIVIWQPITKRTNIILAPGDDQRAVDDKHSLKSSLIYKNDGVHRQRTRSISYVCSTDLCNSLPTLKRLLQALTLQDSFDGLDYLVQFNQDFQGDSCWFFTNSSAPCDMEMNRTTCNQCSIELTSESNAVEVCANCVAGDVIDNFITREVTFNLQNRAKDDFGLIECQVTDCNTLTSGQLIRRKSNVEFNFDLFLHNGSSSASGPWLLAIVLLLGRSSLSDALLSLTE